jgi:predicted metal-dependent phosphoesterase TrpH
VSPGGIVDLHTHSTCSDGCLPPAELVERAAAAGVAMLALTDHDTTEGLLAADAAASRSGVTLVHGVEISVAWRHQSIHILGLWIDPSSRTLRDVLGAQADRRRVRMQKMCAALTRAGLPGSELLSAVEANPGVPTRSHLAAALVAGGHVHRAEDAFRKYLGHGKRAHVAADWPPIGEAVAAIRAAGGDSCIAHPARYTLSSGARRQLVSDFAAAGGAALEIVTGANGAQHAPANAALALRFGLAGSLGSDFHDPQQTWNPLGRLAKLPDGIDPLWRHRIP